ncbi:Uncharacterised protein [Yersinia massiliensis]|uniref:hypothetical protein n=1 Tax=Yersinia massiliensis TaxID=419257 RepID=UPI0005E96B75|nr:hypothetical protein [Yersinia massiliensis]CNH78201.1 Uncharacterised protein [Yersinia massiliensis]
MLFLRTEGLLAIISGAGLLLGSLLSFDALALECRLGDTGGKVDDFENIGTHLPLRFMKRHKMKIDFSYLVRLSAFCIARVAVWCAMSSVPYLIYRSNRVR